MSPLLSWILLLTILGGIGIVAAIVGHVDELPVNPTGWRPMEEEATRVTIKQGPYDQEREEQP